MVSVKQHDVATESLQNTQPAIRLDHVSKRFILRPERARSFQDTFISLVRGQRSRVQEFWALRDVSFEVQPGETVGLIGPNGAGKSTILKLVSRILTPTEGQITVNGKVSSLLELGAGFHPDLTGRENIYLNGSVLGLSRREINERLDDIIAFAELERFIDIPVKHYSSGMYMRLGFAVAVHVEPDILLVDEVLAVGDATFQRKCLDRVVELSRAGVTIMLVSHDLGTIQSFCKRAIWFEKGVIHSSGHPTDVVMAYLNYMAQQEAARWTHSVGRLSPEQRWGTGRMQIRRVELYDSHDKPSRTFFTGDPMEIRIRFRADQQIKDPIFGLAIHHQNGTHICGPNTSFSGLQIPFVEGVGQIIYRIPALPLLSGAYTVSVSVHNRADTEMYDYHDRAYPFHVYPGRSREQYGLIALHGEWRAELCDQGHLSMDEGGENDASC